MEGKPDPFGRNAIRPLDIPVRGWWQVAERVLSESSRDNLSVVAAGCAFYALFAVFPALSALILACPYFAGFHKLELLPDHGLFLLDPSPNRIDARIWRMILYFAAF